MKIQLKAVGDLREHLGRAPHEIELPDGASFANLMIEIGARWGSLLPAHVWDAAQGQFRGAVYLVRGGHAVLDLGTALEDGSEIVLLRPLSGG
jgi:molybdopterin converting factor small subunit